VFSIKATCPIATLSAPVVLFAKDHLPTAVLLLAVVFAPNAA
jgi:hypothetical protein